jgi:hypothetical protein
MPRPVIPHPWLTPARIERVICHWTGGAYLASALDCRHYHVVLQDDQARGIGEDVTAVRGLWRPAANAPIVGTSYAAHTNRLNTGSFGLAAACMVGAVPGGPYGPAPLTRLLWERMAQAAAEVCHAYHLDVTERTVLFHSEVERIYDAPQRGKWDIDVLPFDQALSAPEVHAQFRRKANWYLHRLRADR